MIKHSEWQNTVVCSRNAGVKAHFCGCGYRPEGTLEEQKRLTQEHILANGGELWDGVSR